MFVNHALDFVNKLCYNKVEGGNNMPISYTRLFSLLKEKGYSTYRIRKEKLIGQGTMTALKNGTGGLDHKTVARLCEILHCQPGDIMEYIPDEANSKEGK